VASYFYFPAWRLLPVLGIFHLVMHNKLHDPPLTFYSSREQLRFLQLFLEVFVVVLFVADFFDSADLFAAHYFVPGVASGSEVRRRCRRHTRKLREPGLGFTKPGPGALDGICGACGPDRKTSPKSADFGEVSGAESDHPVN